MTVARNLTRLEETQNRPKTPRHTKNPNISTRAVRIATRGIPFESAGRVVSSPKKGERRGEELREGSRRSRKRRPPSNDRWGNRYETVGSGRGHLGRDGEKGTRPIDLPSPEISAKPPRTPSTHRNSHISTTVERVGKKRVSPGSHKPVEPPCKKARGSTRKCRLGDARLQVANDSARNCMSYSQSEVGARRAASRRRGTARWNPTKLREVMGMLEESWENEESGKNAHPFPRYLLNRLIPHCTLRKPISPQRMSASSRESDVRGELGDRGNKGNGALNPEIFAKRCDTACLPKNCDIFACVGAIATKGIPLERYRRVHPESRFARGTDEWSSRYRVSEVGDDKGTRLPNTRMGGFREPYIHKKKE
ncbi:hypothetical protein EDD16DRAFT_1730684 [Pisolithus croceorrhizus]|nr:hypothetical protein EDD16DRAFT_1730684 [Pisolithus croceorrhizus]